MKERIPSDSFIFLQILSGTDVQLIIQVFLQKRKCTEMQQSSSLCVLDAQPFMRGNRHFVGNIDLVRSALNIPIQNSALPNLLHSLGIIYFTIATISTSLFSTQVYLRGSGVPIKERLKSISVQHKAQLPDSAIQYLFPLILLPIAF